MSFLSLVCFSIFFSLTMILGSMVSVGINAMLGGKDSTTGTVPASPDSNAASQSASLS